MNALSHEPLLVFFFFWVVNWRMHSTKKQKELHQEQDKA